MPASDRLIIRDLELMASVGIYPEEKTARQPIRINIEISVEAFSPGRSDTIDSVVSYEDVIHQIKSLLAARHFHLVETMAEEIATLCLQDSRTSSAKVRVEKTEIFKEARGVGVEIFRENPAR